MRRDIKKIINYTLDKLDMNSEEASELIFKTGEAESGYRALSQRGGPAVGFFQVEPDTILDTWDNYAMYRPELKTKLWGIGFDDTKAEMCVMSSIALQVAFCRLKYRRDPHPLPKVGDIEAQAKYWKRVYNSHKGRGTIKHFIEANGG
jgi:hypothetical protein